MEIAYQLFFKSQCPNQDLINQVFYVFNALIEVLVYLISVLLLMEIRVNNCFP